jgi:hypothetical protein
MIVDDFDVVGVAAPPNKADPPLIVDPNAVLSSAISGKALQPIARRKPKIIQTAGIVDLQQFPIRRPYDVVWNALDEAALPSGFSGCVPERLNHVAPY